MDPQGPLQLSCWLSDNATQEKLPSCKSKAESVISGLRLVVSSQVQPLLRGRH